jgi:hypothetical protein
LAEARELLETARCGLMIAKLGPSEVKAGFRNVAVYGKMVTFCTNNRRGKVDGFEEWDRAAKEKYFNSDVARAMSDVRNQFEKQARNPIFSATHIKSYSPQDLARFPKPENAVGFFIGDRFGGSGWLLQMENGDQLPFYIDLPAEIGESRTILLHEGTSLDLIDAADQYLDALEGYLDELTDFVRNSHEGTLI